MQTSLFRIAVFGTAYCFATTGQAQLATSAGRSPQVSLSVIDSARARLRPAKVVRPEFQSLRYSEQWLQFQPDSGAWEDHLKHVDIARGDVVHLTVNGSLRWRSEFNRNYLMSNAAVAQDQFAASRLLLGSDFRVGRLRGPYIRAYAEYRDAQAYNRTLPGRLTAKELDRHDLQDGFGEIGWSDAGLRVGRQEIILGKERFVGVSDWSNSRRAFNGVRGFAKLGPFTLDVLDVHVMAVRSNQWNLADTASALRAVALTTRREAPARVTWRPAAVHLYLLQHRALAGARHDRTMTGARATWKTPLAMPGGAQAAVDAEIGTQRGYVGTKALDAWFHAVEATVTFKTARYTPMLQVAFDRGSGTKGGTDPHVGTISTMYGSAHSYDGIADALGVGNLRIARVAGGAELTKWLQLRTAVRSYRRTELGDGVYSKANVQIRAASGSPYRDVGVETDVVFTARVSRLLRLQLGGALLTPGRFLTTTPGGAHPYRFIYLGETLTF